MKRFTFIILLLLLICSSGAEAKPSAPIRGMWVWDFEAYETRKERERLIDLCRLEGITLLLVQVHYRTDPNTKLPTGMQDSQAYGDLIQECRKTGIAVEALEGDSHWAIKAGQADFWPKLTIILDWYKSQPANRRFAGLHLDVEPYLLKDFDTPYKLQILREYVEFMAKVRNRVKKVSPDLIFAADIPFWYDVYPEDEYLNHCVVEFNGVKKSTSSHIQDICDYIGIMSYRRHAVGENSIFDISVGEMNYAEKIGKKVFLGVETMPDQDPAYISFWGTNIPWFRKQIGLLEQTCAKQKGFGGILIHHYVSYRLLLESPVPETQQEGPAPALSD